MMTIGLIMATVGIILSLLCSRWYHYNGWKSTLMCRGEELFALIGYIGAVLMLISLCVWLSKVMP